MPFSYSRLWKLLIDKGMTKEELRKALNFSSTTIAKMGKGENVSLEVIEKICAYFSCRIEDIIEYDPSE
jgi:putative transcriptional regulator